jgi:hypothetical protein
MADQEQDHEVIGNRNQADQDQGVDKTRRRFTGAGLTGGILATLASQPVLGATSVQCTISGNLSGNLSRQAGGTPCNICGKGKDYWEPYDECKKKTFHDYMGSECYDYKDSTKNNKCSWLLKPTYENFCLRKDDVYSPYGGGYAKGYPSPTHYDSYPNKGYDAGKLAGRKAVDDKGLNAYKDVNTKGYKDGYYEGYVIKCVSWNHTQAQKDYQRGYRDGYEERCREQYGYETDHCSGEKWDFARECLIAVLNCKIQCVNNYGVTEQEVKDMWYACKDGGQYQVRTDVYWSRIDCMNYLKQLHT